MQNFTMDFVQRAMRVTCKWKMEMHHRVCSTTGAGTKCSFLSALGTPSRPKASLPCPTSFSSQVHRTKHDTRVHHTKDVNGVYSGTSG